MQRPADAPNREEGLQVRVAVEDGRERHYTVPFTRTPDGIQFGEEWTDDARANFLAPVRLIGERRSR